MATIPACTAQACEQGRKPCPTPQACVLAVDDGSLNCAAGVVVSLLWGLGIWVTAVLVVLVVFK